MSSTLAARLGQRQMQPEGVPECREVEPQPQVKTPGRCILYGRSTYEVLGTLARLRDASDSYSAP